MSLICVSQLASQRPPEPAWTIAVFAGGLQDRTLWTVQRQTERMYPIQVAPPEVPDTFNVRRSTGVGYTVGGNLSRRLVGGLRLQLEVSYIYWPVAGHCETIYQAPDSFHWCEHIDSLGPPDNTTYSVSGFLRANLPGVRALQPYVLAGGGIVSHHFSTVTTYGGYLSPTVISDTLPNTTSPQWLGGFGVSASLGSRRRAQVEVRDLVVRFAYVTGPADGSGHAPESRKYFHNAMVSLGLSVQP